MVEVEQEHRVEPAETAGCGRLPHEAVDEHKGSGSIVAEVGPRSELVLKVIGLEARKDIRGASPEGLGNEDRVPEPLDP